MSCILISCLNPLEPSKSAIPVVLVFTWAADMNAFWADKLEVYARALDSSDPDDHIVVDIDSLSDVAVNRQAPGRRLIVLNFHFVPLSLGLTTSCKYGRS